MKQLFSLSIITSLILPSFVFAEISKANTLSENQQTTPTQKLLTKRLNDKKELRASGTSSPNGIGFCSQIDKIIISIDSKEVSLKNKKDVQENKVMEKKAELRSLVDAKRLENETKRKEGLAELAKRATTTQQQTAIATFTEALTKALGEKNTSIDELLSSHRKEIDLMISLRKELADAAFLTLTKDIEQAKSQAKDDCARGVDGKTVRMTLKDSIKKARDDFSRTVQSSPKLREVSSESIKKKKEDVKKIEGNFKQKTETIKNTLKAALKKSTQQTATTTQ